MPRWTALADLTVLVLVVLAVCVLLFGGHREQLGPLRIAITSWLRLVVIAAVLAAARHAILPRPPLHARLLEVWDRARASASLRAAWSASVATRLAVLAVGYFAVHMFGFIPHMVRFRVSNNELVNLAARWDAEWYLRIARDGYSWNGDPSTMQTVAFFPAVPLTMHLGAFFAGGQLVNGGLLVSLAAFFVALRYLYRLTASFGGDEAAGRTAVWAIAAYPFAVYFSAPYSEGLYLLGCLGAFYHALRGEYRWTAAYGLLVGLSRPNGFLLTVPLAIIVGQRALGRAARPREWPAAATPIVAVAAHSIYMYLRFEDPIVWLRAHGAWGRAYAGVWGNVSAFFVERYEQMAAGFYNYSSTQPFDSLHTLAGLFAVISIWPAFRRFGLAFAVFTAMTLAAAVGSGGTMALGRMTSVLFPAFMWLGVALPRGARLPLVAAFCIGQGLVAAVFFSWRPLY